MAAFDFTDKNILITGGSSGIGRTTAIECVKAGANVIIVGRKKEELDRTAAMSGHPEKCRAILFDFSSDDSYDALFQNIAEYEGKLDGLVHCAGVPGVIPLRALTQKNMSEVMGVNYFSFIELVKQYSKKKYNNGGSIIGVSSVVAERGEMCQTIYAASKAAMEASVKCLSIELASKQIRINTVMPGMIRTEMMEQVLENGSDARVLGAGSVLGIGDPVDVSNAILFLLSDLSSHTTGRSLYVDGGCFL